jgi:hypothetical protein
VQILALLVHLQKNIFNIWTWHCFQQECFFPREVCTSLILGMWGIWEPGRFSLCLCCWACPMDGWTIKTPNPICRLFFKIDLLTDFAALCWTDFIDWRMWRYIHSWLQFSTQLVNCCPHERRNYVYLCTIALFLLSDLPPSSLPKLNESTVHIYTLYRQCVAVGGGGGVELCCRPYSAGVLHSVSDQI